MVSLFGPVFELEARLAARKRRTYVLRLVYGLLLLLVAYLQYDQKTTEMLVLYGRVNSHQGMAQVGTSLFLIVATFQQAAVFFLTPALVAGAIATDRQRKILGDLLTTQLSSREIVWGKLAARVLNAAMLFAVGLPVVAITTLLGGIEPRLLFLSFLATASTLWFLAGVSMLASVFAAKARDAFLLVYAFLGTWLLLPLMLRPLLLIWWPGLQTLLWPLLRAIEVSSPFAFSEMLTRRIDQLDPFYKLFVIQVLMGTAAVAVAAFCLRFDVGGSPRVVKAEGHPRRRWFARPRVSDRPMLWKERHVTRGSTLVRLGLWLVGAPLTLILVEQTWDGFWPAFDETRKVGYGDSLLYARSACNQFNMFVRDTSGIGMLVWMVALAAVSGASVAGEREEDTWISLRCTLLTGREILIAKGLGALWRTRWIGLAIVSLWVLALVAGALHPLALPMLLFDFVCLSGFSVAMGLFYSLICRNTTVALVASIGTLFLINTSVILTIGSHSVGITPVGLSPLQVRILAAPYGEIDLFFGRVTSVPAIKMYRISHDIDLALLGALLHGLAGLGLFARSVAMLDEREKAAPPVLAREIRFLAEEPAPASVAGSEQ